MCTSLIINSMGSKMYSQQVGKYLRMCKLMIFSFILDLSSILKSKCNFLNIKIAIQRLVDNTIFDEKRYKNSSETEW